MSDSELTDPTLSKHMVTIDGAPSVEVHLRIGEKIQVKVVSKETLAIEDKYEKLLEFVKKIPELDALLNINELYDLGFEVKQLLREIGEL